MTSDTTTGGIERAFALDGSLSHLLHRAQQMAANRSAQALRDAGITLRQFSVLAAASGEVGPSQSRLVELTGIDRSTLADMLARMEQSGLIERQQSEEDARAKSVALTKQGQAALDVAAPAVREADEALIALLAKNRRNAFLDLLSTLITSSEASIEKARTAPDSDSDESGAPSETKSKSKKSKDKAKAKDKDKPKAKKKKKKKEKA